LNIASQADARIERVFVRSGQPIRAGQLLARLDREMLAAVVRQAQADLEAAKAALERARAELLLAQGQAVAEAKKAQASIKSARTSVALARTESTRRAVSGSEQIRQARAQLAQARAEMEVAEIDRPELIAQARAELAEAEAIAQKAQNDLARYSHLFEMGFISASTFENARSALDIANARLAVARERLKRVESASQEKLVEAARQRVASAEAALALALASQFETTYSRQQISLRQAEVEKALAELEGTSAVWANIKMKQEDIAAAQAQVEGAKAARAAARKALAESDILSPVAGVVVAKFVNPGELASRGEPLFLVLDQSKPCWIRAFFSERRIARIRPGQPARITINAYGRRVFQGRIEAIGEVAATGNPSAAGQTSRERPTGSAAEIAVRIGFDSQELRMIPGLSAKVRVRVR